MNARFLSLLLGMSLGAVAQAEVSVQKFDWTRNNGAFELSVDEATQLTGTLEPGKTASVDQGGIHAELRSYEPGGLVAVILSEDNDMTATISILAPPDYHRMNCLDITDNRERVARDFDGVLQKMQMDNPIWDSPQKRLQTIAYFFSKDGGDRDLSTFFDQIENGSLRTLPPSYRCGDSANHPIEASTPDKPTASDTPAAVAKDDKAANDPRLNPMGNTAYGDWLARRQKLAEQQHLRSAAPQAENPSPQPMNQQVRRGPMVNGFPNQRQGWGTQPSNWPYQPRM